MNISIIVRQLASATILSCLVISGAGCADCKPGRPGKSGKYEVQIRIDDTLKRGSVLVDLVGANAGSLSRWEAYPMSKYWNHSDPMRESADKVVLDFSANNPTSQTLAVTDKKWGEWIGKGATHVLVLADLPDPTDKPGTADARRQILPLDRCHWPKGTKKLSVVVKQSGVEIETAPRAPK